MHCRYCGERAQSSPRLDQLTRPLKTHIQNRHYVGLICYLPWGLIEKMREKKREDVNSKMQAKVISSKCVFVCTIRRHTQTFFCCDRSNKKKKSLLWETESWRGIFLFALRKRLIRCQKSFREMPVTFQNYLQNLLHNI